MLNRRNAYLALLAALLMVMLDAPVVHAQAGANATGTWKWQQTFGRGGGGRRAGGGGPGGGGGGGAPSTQPGAPGGGGGGGGRFGGRGPQELTGKFTQAGDKLTGSIVGMNFGDPTASTEIKEGTVKGTDVTFKVETAGRGGGPGITWTYKGKLEGDKITGTREADFNGNPISQEWTAERQKP